MRINWNVPEGRFFDTGLDRGVLYPKGTPPIGPVLDTNVILNPSFEGGATVADTWVASSAGNNGTLSYALVTTEGVTSQVTAQRITSTGQDNLVTSYAGIALAANVPLPSGPAYARVNMTVVQLHDGHHAKMIVRCLDLSSATLLEVVVTATATGEMEASFVAPPGTVKAKVYLRHGGTGTGPAGAISNITTWDSMLLKAGDKTAYFDGASLDTKVNTFEWSGTANASSSIRREVLTKAVPWFGLQSVDEEGSESAAAYYIDGRPFLFLPKPKEFKATLKAVTYPDAFSEIMGIQEVADGMYLDSQPGDTFDLAYRTLVGNGIEGIDHGYKIHLVYNCTVSPQALTYESLSNSINPTAFSWEIQAVPVPIEGFRPTAHIIIDTRHMDQQKIDAVESRLYGSEDDVAHMPTPQAIFDLLSFGDTIIVIDNGDGTFDVIGSYENVYMVDDGIFRVDNVDGTDNGDGTFTISTTLE